MITKHTYADVLRFAGELLADPSRRCVGVMAQDATGSATSELDPSACRWCLFGSVVIAANKLRLPLPAVLERANHLLGLRNTISYEWDHGTQKKRDAIVAKLRAAT
jgi:hypothetical protein